MSEQHKQETQNTTDSNRHPENPKVMNTNEARQGSREHVVSRILIISLALAVLAVGFAAWLIG